VRTVAHRIAGQETAGDSTRTAPIWDPATGKQQAQVLLAERSDVDRAVRAAAAAFVAWGETSLAVRTRIMFAFRQLVCEHAEELAQIVSSEHGKVLEDARGEVTRGLEVVDFACGLAQLLKGEYSDQVSSGVDAFSFREPLGVCAGTTPFNFPAMVPMWMHPIAIATGNAFVLKPSERDPSASNLVAELYAAAGLPDGVFNVLHGDKVAVDALLEHPDVAAVSFVGSTPIARYVHGRASAAGKRVQALGGAKNHAVVMPDADLDHAVVTAAARERIVDYIGEGERAGARLVLDGREPGIPGEGFWVGPTLFDRVSTEMSIYQEEIFGPVLSVVRVADLDAAIELVNSHSLANGAAIFTASGATARTFQRRAHVGMVGVNVPIPVPMAYHSFGGWRSSLFGDHHMHGPEGVRFYTRLKAVTARWPAATSAAAEDKRSGMHFPTSS
jgi:malonate-semialdehyde dehydrogenase (acetylating)/methylmalonate-semialdehyde dehydrogenase